MASPSSSSRPMDPAWVHAKVDAASRNAIICLHCGKKISRGHITRFKHHLAGIPGQVESCKKVPNDVKRQIIQQIDEKWKSEERRYEIREVCDSHVEDSSHAIFSTEGGSGSQLRPPRKRKTGYFPPQAATGSEPSSGAFMASEDMVQHGMGGGAEAPNDLSHEARIAMARWWYDADVPFSAAKSPFYQPMLETIVSAGLGFKGPSYHDLRKPLLKHIAEDIHGYLDDLKREWSIRGCSIIADRQKGDGEGSIISFLVYCPRGTMFLKSVDTSTERADLLAIFDQVIREVGPKNVVQFITDIDPRYKATVKILEERYGTFVWSPCAVHCIDLMLENFADPRYFPKMMKP